MPYLTPVQRRVLRVGDRKGAKQSERIAAMMTSIVESSGGNPSGGMDDSGGWRQERRMYYPNPTNVRASAGRFYDEIKSTRGSKQTPGQKAQAVQRSAYPGKYDAVRRQAVALVRQYDRRNGGRGGVRIVPGTPGTPKSKVTVGVKPPYMRQGRTEFDKTGFILDQLGRGVKGRLKNRITKDFLKELADPASPYKTEIPAVTKPGKTKDIKIPGSPGKKGYLDPGDGGTVKLKDGSLLGRPKKDGWKGSQAVGEPLARALRLPISSRKRATVNTASGNVSDHYEGNKDAYAWDLSATGATGTKKARQLAKMLGVKGWQGGSWLNITKTIAGRTYRFQIGWNVPDHYDHIHFGVRRVA